MRGLSFQMIFLRERQLTHHSVGPLRGKQKHIEYYHYHDQNSSKSNASNQNRHNLTFLNIC